jgi:valyl-tRNA synthetase
VTADAPPTTAPTSDRRELLPQYAPTAVEGDLYARWVERGYFGADAETVRRGDRPGYCIVIPPPNVTGSLHMGHAFQHTLMDALTRRRRMQGYESLWLPGMDHAGIATQNVVERELAKEGLSRHDLGRDAFVARVWQWKAEYGGKILGQMRRLGDGVDWSRERFTMDDGLSRAVRTMFTRMYADGLIYRAERIINWCPRCLTALSDIEVEHTEDPGELVSIRYGDGDRALVVATTRVETMLGDTAVAVHPDDERYRHLVGTTVELPLVGRRIPIVADTHVDPAFGTGAVKVTPAHDPNDFEIGQRHGLAMPAMMDDHARITIPGPFDGMDRFEARPAVRAALAAEGRIVAEQRPYLHAVGHCSRCNTVVEPRLSLQWFVKVAPLATAAGDAVRDGSTAIHPPEMAGRYYAWVDNMHDWCISRQLWWGHRIPVWYCSDGHPTAPPDGTAADPTACATCGRTDIIQDDDVLDTWFSSGLWPFSTLGWPDQTPDLAAFYPTDVLLTGYDIIFFWVARMMMFGCYAMPDVPFRTIALTGLIRDGKGKKMSKSHGNAVDPLDWIDRYGADALRFTLARGANPGTDVPVTEDWVQGSRNFVNKLWNASRFALLNGASTASGLPPREQLSAADRWILSRLAAVTAEVDGRYEDYQFAKACDTLFHFAWDEVFDWYVELAKIPLAAGGEAAATTRAVLGHVLDTVLRLLHPVVPFVTETLWTALTGTETLVTAAWPGADLGHADPGAEAEIARLQELVTEVRRFRAEQGLRPRQRVPAVLVLDEPAAALSAYAEQIATLIDVRPLAVRADAPQGWPVVSAAGARLALDLSDAIDVGAERNRLAKAQEAARKELSQVGAKLGNAEFVAKAPPAVVEKMRVRQGAAAAELDRVAGLLAALPMR